MKLKYSLVAVFLAQGISLNAALAGVETSVVESKVTVIPAPQEKVTTYKIFGPDKIEYVLEGPPSEITRLSEIVKTNPETVVRFEGDYVSGPQKVFRLKKWSNNTETKTDGWGNKTTTTTHTETTTER